MSGATTQNYPATQSQNKKTDSENVHEREHEHEHGNAGMEGENSNGSCHRPAGAAKDGNPPLPVAETSPHLQQPSTAPDANAAESTASSGVKPNTAENDADSPQHSGPASPADAGPARQNKKRKKVGSACVYCRRSHMNCDESRPCKRCIKRNIGHLCHDDIPKSKAKDGSLLPTKDPHSPDGSKDDTKTAPSGNLENHLSTSLQANFLPSSTALNQQPFFYSEHAGSEFNSLTEFLSMIDDNDMMDTISLTNDPMLQKLEATNYISGFTNSTANLQNMMSNSTNTMNNDINHNTNESQFNKGSANASNHLNMSTDVNQNLSKLDQQQLNYIQQQLNVQQQKLLQHQQYQQKPMQLDHQLNGPSQSHQFLTGSGKQQQKPHLPYEASNYQEAPFKTPSQQHAQIFPQKSPTLQKAPHNTPHISDAARDKFFLTAADPTTEISPEERLKQVINAKLEAGLLKPYNYAKGYQRLQTYMDKYMATSSRARILKPLSTFRPGFRAIAKTLKDIDLILVEESFERMLLDYDRVFTSMAIPACLWRRTGEIYRGNKEFASLVDVSIEDLKNGKLTIYELMTEESSVNFWEKYGSIAFDKTQKAVLTSCNLRTKDGRKKKNCCFSFTIRRDRYNIPSCIVGNFIPIR